MFKMRSEILVLKNTIFWYKIRIFGCQNMNFCFSKLAGLWMYEDYLKLQTHEIYRVIYRV